MPTIAIGLVQALLDGIGAAPALLASAQTLIAMFAKGSITDAELSAIWTANVLAVRDAEAAWKAANVPAAP